MKESALTPGARATVGANRREARERAEQCSRILETIAEELARLEEIKHMTQEDLEAFSMAKGFVQRAHAVLATRARW